MKALTVQQPWAWAIIHGGKNVENRTQLYGYRGDLAIHAGKRWSERGGDSALIAQATNATAHVWKGQVEDAYWTRGAIIGVVRLVGAHHAEGRCCRPWGESEYVEHPTGRVRRRIIHLELTDPQPIDPIPAIGHLGLWTPDAELTQMIRVAA